MSNEPKEIESKKKSRRKRFTTEQFIERIPGTGGIISVIAARVGCDRHTARKYIDTYPTIKQAYDDECEKTLDMIESKAVQVALMGDTQMMRYYLSTKGKNRGFTEKTETDTHVTFSIEYGDDGDSENGE